MVTYWEPTVSLHRGRDPPDRLKAMTGLPKKKIKHLYQLGSPEEIKITQWIKQEKCDTKNF